MVVPSSPPFPPSPRSLSSQQNSCDGCRKKIRQRPRQHGPDTQLREVSLALRDQSADPAKLDTDRAEVGEARQSEGSDRERTRVQLALHGTELGEGDKLVQYHPGAQQAPDGAAVMPGYTHDPRDWAKDPTEHRLEIGRKPLGIPVNGT